ncbi:MAG TPA: RNA polymerase sigma factor [Polyangiaceae bacterium]|jgi:RNA polymerase sigma-70 factor (ECF subfamily)|nr:RNA polymerase sigma factor [Polyangiaceae bacterium]
MRTDEELMAAYVVGDTGAFRELFERHSPVLMRVMRHQLRRPEDARDLVQQTFLQLHRSRNDFRAGAQLKPWLFTIAMNLKREYFRRAGRRPETVLELDGRTDPAVAPRGHEQLEAADELGFALRQLPEEQREVITLHWLGGVPLPDVAEMVGASLSAVKVRAHRGYAAMRRALGEPGNPEGA